MAVLFVPIVYIAIIFFALFKARKNAIEEEEKKNKPKPKRDWDRVKSNYDNRDRYKNMR